MICSPGTDLTTNTHILSNIREGIAGMVCGVIRNKSVMVDRRPVVVAWILRS